jgi:multiple sugar transport system substrate-binding protein
LDADAVRAQFAEGRIGMIPGASFDISVYNDQFPASCNWSVVPVPAFTEDGSTYKEFADATSLLGVGIAAKEKAAKTLQVLKFFYSDVNAAQMYENSLYIPLRQEAIDLAEKDPEQKGFAAFANIPDRVLMRPSPENSIAVEGDEYRKTIANYFAGVYEGQKVIEVLENLDKRYNSALEKLSPGVLKGYIQIEEVQTEEVLFNNKK